VEAGLAPPRRFLGVSALGIPWADPSVQESGKNILLGNKRGGIKEDGIRFDVTIAMPLIF
jgi:hypothetical protein